MKVDLGQAEWDDVLLALKVMAGAFSERGEPLYDEALFSIGLKIAEQVHQPVGRPFPSRFSFER